MSSDMRSVPDLNTYQMVKSQELQPETSHAMSEDLTLTCHYHHHFISNKCNTNL